MAPQKLRNVAAAILTLTLAIGAGACGEDEEPADSSDTSADPAASDAAETEAGSPSGGVTFVDATDAAATVTVSDVGFEPAEVTVSTGDVVVFTTDGGEGVFGVIVGDLDGYTVTNGLDEYFRFDVAGTYEVREDISGATASVTVE